MKLRKNIFNMIKIYSEYLSDDILEEHFIKIYRCYRRVQTILGSCRVDIRDRFVTAPTVYQKCYTIALVAISTYLYICTNILIYDNKVPDRSYSYYMYFCVLLLSYVSYICNIIHVRFVNSDENSKFLIQLQKIDRLMEIDGNKSMYGFIYLTNIVTLALLLTSYVLLYGASWYKNVRDAIELLGEFCNEVTFAIEISHCANTTVFLVTRLRFLNSIILNHLQKDDENNDEKKESIFPTKSGMRYIASKTHDFVSTDTYVCLKAILDAYSKFQMLYRFQVLLFCIKSVGTILTSFNIIFLSLQDKIVKKKELDLFVYVQVPFITTLDIFICTFMCVRNQLLFKEVDTIKRLCTKIMCVHYTGPLRDKAKKMLKLIEEAPPKFSVYDMWQMDVFFLLKVFNILTTYIITTLQFALL
nr:gustatory receptor 41 [Papilio dardanus]